MPSDSQTLCSPSDRWQNAKTGMLDYEEGCITDVRPWEPGNFKDCSTEMCQMLCAHGIFVDYCTDVSACSWLAGWISYGIWTRWRVINAES